MPAECDTLAIEPSGSTIRRSHKSYCSDPVTPIKQHQGCIVMALFVFLGLLRPAGTITLRKKKKKVGDRAAFTLRDWFSRRWQAHRDDERHDDAFFALIDWLHGIVASTAVRLEVKRSNDQCYALYTSFFFLFLLER